MYENAIIKRSEIKRKKTATGIMLQELGRGQLMNALHWDIESGSVVDWHSHPAEQFGYVIKGRFIIFFENEEFEIHEGDCYYVPSNVSHKFIALGDTEAIDIFNPIKEDIPKEIQ
ncbi:MAG: cupin domain-containing protein [Lachnospiraceae bacterium]|nr:cupin domain-containing protein [Lachnospiraceae bacterium]